MQARQRAQPTGTNRPTRTTTPHTPPHRRGGGANPPRPLRSPGPTHPPPHTRGGRATQGRTTTPPPSRRPQRGRETPGPIPNPEAKPPSADGTAPTRERKSRTPPGNTPPRSARGSASVGRPHGPTPHPPHTPPTPAQAPPTHRAPTTARDEADNKNHPGTKTSTGPARNEDPPQETQQQQGNPRPTARQNCAYTHPRPFPLRRTPRTVQEGRGEARRTIRRRHREPH